MIEIHYRFYNQQKLIKCLQIQTNIESSKTKQKTTSKHPPQQNTYIKTIILKLAVISNIGQKISIGNMVDCVLQLCYLSPLYY